MTEDGYDVAAWLGEPVVTAGDDAVVLYVGGPVEASIVVRRHGMAQQGTGGASFRMAPVHAAITSPPDPEVADVGGWIPAPRLAVALDLAQDPRVRLGVGIRPHRRQGACLRRGVGRSSRSL